MSVDVRNQARVWLQGEASTSDAARITAAIDVAEIPLLSRWFGAPLTFGTAGLRGVVHPGPAGMNTSTVRIATWALAEVLTSEGPDVAHRGVVVARDARHGSDEFFLQTVGVLASRGLKVFAFLHPTPTPLVPYALKSCGAAAGIVVTASHNPPEYNGYKVYWSHGAQILSPIDSAIESAMKRAPLAKDIACELNASIEWLGVELIQSYARAVQVAAAHHVPLKVAYTPLHGVGGAMAAELMRGMSEVQFEMVSSQLLPDADFPTVRFPNPEEAGAMDAVIDCARQMGATLAIANDPDADRLACAAPQSNGQWARLSGNQLGLLLADEVLRCTAQLPNRFVATTVVSSMALGKLAHHRGVECGTTLTGFKWLMHGWRAARERGLKPVFAYEEALGYAVNDAVEDKDGLSAMVVLIRAAQRHAKAGLTLWGALEVLEQELGAFRSGQRTKAFAGSDASATMAKWMASLRQNLQAPKFGSAWTVRDFLKSADPNLHTDMIELTQQGARVLIRPSGTEPKLKVYIETTSDSGAAAEAHLSEVFTWVDQAILAE